MRIVIDMQGVQGSNRERGIGRYSLSLISAIARNTERHEIILVLNGNFKETIKPIRAEFNDILPQEKILVWNSPVPVDYLRSENTWRRRSAELLRETFIVSLDPDVVLVTSLFEGLGDDAVTSIKTISNLFPTAAILYDLIPYIYRHPYLDNPIIENWYENKLAQMRRADMVLAISESSRQEGTTYLGFSNENSVNISAAVSPHFRPINIDQKQEAAIRDRYNLSRSFLMYTGGIDHRKNIEALIRAYSKLPKKLKSRHQLAVVCAIGPEDKDRLEKLAKQHYFLQNELILTGFVPEEDLIALYNLSKLFVFPSWHEGFGLPALEAMSCGTAVIGANTSSVPEVIGRNDALFDPRSDEAITTKIAEVLSDDRFRQELETHGLEQAKNFSCDKSAKITLAALEKMFFNKQQLSSSLPQFAKRPRMAFISPLPPERSGISDYSAELLPELSRYYDIDVIIAQETVSDSYINANCAIRNLDWFRVNAERFDRVLYHFGNSAFHQHMFALLDEFPGVVVLHDFYLSGIIHHMSATGMKPEGWVKELYHSHGYNALHEHFKSEDVADLIWKYPCCKSVLENVQGMIVHSENSKMLARNWFGSRAAEDMTIIPHLRVPVHSIDKGAARRDLGFSDDDFIICSFGMLGPHKLNHVLLQAWLDSELAKDKRCHLVFVGKNHPAEYGEKLQAVIRNSGAERRILITGWANREMFCNYLAAADLGVQLRALSRGETSGTVLDCMNYGLPTIINANGSMADLPDEVVHKLPDEFSTEQLTHALEALWSDKICRVGLGRQAREKIIKHHSPRRCADQYAEAIEHFQRQSDANIAALTKALALIIPPAQKEHELISLANCIAHSIPPRPVSRQLFVDVSELIQRDSRSGIQRVVRSLLREWLENPPKGLRIEPVYATVDQGYRYARIFTLGYLECPTEGFTDEPIEYHNGDIFLGLDLQPQVVPAQREYYQQMRRHGVTVKFVVYDLLCIQMPQNFVKGAAEVHSRWLEVVAENDGAICISKAVADELKVWMAENGPKRYWPFEFDWFHLGADVENSVPSTGLPDDAERILERIRQRKSFLMVGTLEPRKGHTQTLEAFEGLWADNLDVNLVIVGKQGWMVDQLAERLRDHPESGCRLFSLEGISDEFLDKIYNTATCLIAASEGEGFGLPLIEAAKYGLPIMARDIAVFREVAGEYASYFTNRNDAHSGLADGVINWLNLYEKGIHPKSSGMPILTWRQSANQLLSLLTQENNR